MESRDNLNQPPQSVEVGSGDFQPNPIYGDQPPATISTYENTNQFQNEQQDDYQYPQNEEEDDDDDINNPFNDDASAQAGGPPQDTMAQQQMQSNNRGAPPPYSEDPPSPPVAYQPQPVYGNGTHEPEDVVAQMNAQHPDVYRDDDPDYGITQPKTEDHIVGAEADEDEGEGFFGNFFIRAVYMASALLFCSMLSFSVWFTDLKDNWCVLENITDLDDGGMCNAYKTAYGLSGFGMLPNWKCSHYQFSLQILVTNSHCKFSLKFLIRKKSCFFMLCPLHCLHCTVSIALYPKCRSIYDLFGIDRSSGLYVDEEIWTSDPRGEYYNVRHYRNIRNGICFLSHWSVCSGCCME